MEDRYDRNIRFFGKQGQEILRAANVGIIGVGGLGSHVVQQLSFLGIGGLILIDNEELDGTNLNRYVGARYDDPIPGTRKVDLGERIANSIDPSIRVAKVFGPLLSEQSFEEIIKADYVFGCVDNDSTRFILNELCSAYCIPYIDLASDINPKSPLSYGGRVTVAWDGSGCLYCADVLDMKEVQQELDDPSVIRERDAIYGVSRSLLAEAGPSVVSVNGVIASLAVTEFTVGVTGIRTPRRHLNYHGHLGKITDSRDEPHSDCYYCKKIRGSGEKANTTRYITINGHKQGT